MQFVSGLVWQPLASVPLALRAPFTINFATDQNWTVQFASDFQGDVVPAISLELDNSANNTPITYSAGAITETIPPYCIATIDVVGFYGMGFTCANGVSVNCKLMNYHVPSSFIPATPATSALTNDPFFSSVVGLYHFDGIGGTKIFVDSSKNGFGNFSVGAPVACDVITSLFGGGSLGCSNSGFQIPQCITNVAQTLGLNWTLEFAINTQFNASLVGKSINLFQHPDTGANFTLQLSATFGANNYGFGFSNTAGLNLAYTAGNPLSMNYGVWNYFSLCAFGKAVNMYFNGVGVAAGAASVNPTPVSGQFIIPNNASPPTPSQFNIDELRITNASRYTNANYKVQNSPFLNQ
jgi:hypothetical protein